LVGNPQGERSFGGPRDRYEDNIKMDLKIVWEGMYWIQLSQDKIQWFILNEDSNEPLGSIKGGEFFD
jgi:hypothetical protein